jgi:hypothetical protein
MEMSVRWLTIAAIAAVATIPVWCGAAAAEIIVAATAVPPLRSSVQLHGCVVDTYYVPHAGAVIVVVDGCLRDDTQ